MKCLQMTRKVSLSQKHSPGFVSVDDRWKERTQICTGADQQQDDRQQTLKVEDRAHVDKFTICSNVLLAMASRSFIFRGVRLCYKTSTTAAAAAAHVRRILCASCTAGFIIRSLINWQSDRKVAIWSTSCGDSNTYRGWLSPISICSGQIVSFPWA